MQEEIYFKQFPEGRARLKRAHIAYVRARPAWMGYSNYDAGPPEILGFSGDELARVIAPT